MAAANGHFDTVRALLDGFEWSPFDLNTPDIHGLTPLLVAARNGHIRIVRLLLRYTSKAYSCRFRFGATLEDIDPSHFVNANCIDGSGNTGKPTGFVCLNLGMLERYTSLQVHRYEHFGGSLR